MEIPLWYSKALGVKISTDIVISIHAERGTERNHSSIADSKLESYVVSVNERDVDLFLLEEFHVETGFVNFESKDHGEQVMVHCATCGKYTIT